MGREIKRMNFDLHEMFSFRRAGWSYSDLGRKYGKDHSTIMHHCRKYGIVAEVLISRRKPRILKKRQGVLPKVKKSPTVPKTDKYAHILYPPTKKARSYKSYLKEAMLRPTERHYFQNEMLVIPTDPHSSSSF